MIPKKIHYCWFGGNSKPDLIQKCIASWRKHCPDWEIIEWNEKNYDVFKCTFTKEAFQAKKWAFVSDYVRMDVVYHNGGVYLDTDVELFMPLDDLCEYDAFFCFETGRNLGQGLGAMPRHKAIKNCLDYYDKRHFVVDGKMQLISNTNSYCESVLAVYPDVRRDGSGQISDNSRFLSVTEYNERMVHYCAGSWGTQRDQITKSTRKYRDSGIKRWLRKPSKFVFIEKHFGKKVARLYTWCSYDLLDRGVWYYLKRILIRKE